jgi:hypothetical protein
MLELDDQILDLWVRLSTHFDNLVAWELQLGNIHSIASHEVAIENSKDGFMSDDKEVIVLPFQFKDNRLKTNSKVVV